jgi:hypothetical protein
MDLGRARDSYRNQHGCTDLLAKISQVPLTAKRVSDMKSPLFMSERVWAETLFEFTRTKLQRQFGLYDNFSYLKIIDNPVKSDIWSLSAYGGPVYLSDILLHYIRNLSRKVLNQTLV